MDSLERNRKWFNRVAKYYDSIFSGWMKNIEQRTLQSIAIKRGSRIMDVGCGTGNFLRLLSKQNKGLELHGIDISEGMLKIARKKTNADVKIMAAEQMKYKLHFDYVFSMHAFHHYANQSAVIKNIYRSLKRGGQLIIVDVDFGKAGNKIFRIFEPANTGMHTAKNFVDLLEKYNFTRVEKKEIGLFSVLVIGMK